MGHVAPNNVIISATSKKSLLPGLPTLGHKLAVSPVVSYSNVRDEEVAGPEVNGYRLALLTETAS